MGELPEFTLDELKEYRGENGKPIYVAIDGVVFDVTESKQFYGKGGAYYVFAGRDATRGLAKGLLDENDVVNKPGNKEDFTAMDFVKLEDWLDRFQDKYRVVGTLKSDAKTKPKL